MCFYNDYEWFAESVEITDKCNDKKRRCKECSRWIHEGEWIHWVEMQENECCDICGNRDDDCEHDYGESYTYWRCKTCEKILRAIQAVEEREGCPLEAQQPCYEGMYEELIDHDNAIEYAREAVAMYPEVRLEKIIVRIFEREGEA